jgi:hypothetical protein
MVRSPHAAQVVYTFTAHRTVNIRRAAQVVKFQESLGSEISRERNESTLGGKGLAVGGSARSSTGVVDADNVIIFDHNNIPVLRRLIRA